MDMPPLPTSPASTPLETPCGAERREQRLAISWCQLGAEASATLETVIVE